MHEKISTQDYFQWVYWEETERPIWSPMRELILRTTEVWDKSPFICGLWQPDPGKTKDKEQADPLKEWNEVLWVRIIHLSVFLKRIANVTYILKIDTWIILYNILSLTYTLTVFYQTLGSVFFLLIFIGIEVFKRKVYLCEYYTAPDILKYSINIWNTCLPE